MNSFANAIKDLVAMNQRGSISEAELKRMVQYFLQAQPSTEPETDGSSELVSALPSPSSSPQSAELPPQWRRRSFGRGSSGWVDRKRARDLVLVSLSDLDGKARRSQILDHIKVQWGHHFTETDREILHAAREPRWRKNCNWGFYYLSGEELIERIQRGLYSLSPAGKREAKASKQNLPT